MSDRLKRLLRNNLALRFGKIKKDKDKINSILGIKTTLYYHILNILLVER